MKCWHFDSRTFRYSAFSCNMIKGTSTDLCVKTLLQDHCKLLTDMLTHPLHGFIVSKSNIQLKYLHCVPKHCTAVQYFKLIGWKLVLIATANSKGGWGWGRDLFWNMHAHKPSSKAWDCCLFIVFWNSLKRWLDADFMKCIYFFLFEVLILANQLYYEQASYLNM